MKLRFWARRPKRRIVGGMATMPSRQATFEAALPHIIPQVDRLFLYLDGHAEAPSFVHGEERITAILSRDVLGLHASGKFLPLWQISDDFLFAGFDDDILYPPFYTEKLAATLAGQGSRAVAGYHGAILAEPMRSYLSDRRVLHFARSLPKPRRVDVLGTGTLMFDTGALRFDARSWDRPNVLDLRVAQLAADARLPMICVKRGAGELQALAENQPDSCYAALVEDDSYETALAARLMRLHRGGRNDIAR